MMKKKSFIAWTFGHFRCFTLRPFWVYLGQTLQLISLEHQWRLKSFITPTFGHFNNTILVMYSYSNGILGLLSTLAYLGWSIHDKKSFMTWTLGNFRFFSLRPFWVYKVQTLYLICRKRGWLRKKVLSLEHLVIFLSQNCLQMTQEYWRYLKFFFENERLFYSYLILNKDLWTAPWHSLQWHSA
jgi:hypothetical protein